MKIALAQINPTVGDIEGNSKKIIKYIREARKQKIDLIAFPELSLCGYPPEDLLFKEHFLKSNKKFLSRISKESKDIVVVAGFAHSQGNKIYNSAGLLFEGKIKSIYNKVYLPNYGVFDERRYFSSGEEIYIYQYQGYKFAVTICEDIWIKEYVNFLSQQELDFIINISSSPFYLGKVKVREKVLSFAAKKTKSFIFYCNLVGGQDELVFDGTSKVVSPSGSIVKYALRFKEDLLIFDFKKNTQYPPEKISYRCQEEVFSALSLGLCDYVNKNSFKEVVIGVSGGIDSAVVLSIAALSLGKERVKALIMPSPYTSEETFSDAIKICENLKIKYEIIHIDNIFRSYLKELSPFFKEKGSDITEENLQARIRGNLLMAFSNKFGYLVLNTGNKSETSCGYCTLYGDMVGGFGVLKDVPKTLVYKLAHYINKKYNNIIPLTIIKRPPSAELKHNQKDTDTLPPYNLLDKIIKLYVENNLSFDRIIKYGYAPSLVKRVITMIDRNEYKRRQAPVGIKITPLAFGKDRRMPITNRYIDNL